MHSDISMRSAGNFHFGLRSWDATRSLRVPAGIVRGYRAPQDEPISRTPAEDPDVAKYPFLSQEWMDEARKVRAEYQGKTAPIATSVRMNQVITDVPFGDGTVNSHVDTSSGELVMEEGHLDTPDLTVTLDYETAKAILVDANPQAGMQAFMAGKIKVQGDMSKLMAMQSQAPDATALEIQQRIKDLTE
jgi:putative sterol carrier protein